MQTNSTAPVVAIAAGYGFSMVLTANNELLTTGYNYFGQLCNGARSDSSETDTRGLMPVSLSALNSRNITGMSAGPTFIVILTQDGRVFTCGRNDKSQVCTKKTALSN